MKKNKTDAKSILQSIKALFSSDTKETTQDKFAGATAAYNVANGGVPVYVDISDDNIPDIDQGDNVYADATGTTPYPDGTYTVDGTQFSFTVVAGVVTLVVDPANAGPGQPIQQQAAPAQQATPPAPIIAPTPAPIQVPAPQFNVALPENFAAFKALFNDATAPISTSAETIYTQATELINKFATGTLDERIANLESMAKALMLYCFGYDIKRAEEQIAVNEAINTYKTITSDLQATSQKQKAEIEKYKQGGEKLIALFEEFLNVPDSEPATLSEKDKIKINKNEAKEARVDKIAAMIKENKNK